MSTTGRVSPSGRSWTLPPIMNLLDAALDYATTHRLAVIPLEPGEKRPAFKTGPNHSKLATLNPEVIEGWWAHADYNIGLPCTPNRLAVIDVDGAEGQSLLDQLEAEHGALPETWTQSSQRADRPSVQFVYRWPNNEMVPTRQLGPQLEVRAHGAQIVAAPSWHPTGSRYTWLIAPGETDLVDLPEWVLTLLTRPHTAPVQAQALPLQSNAEKRLQGLQEAVATAAEGNRNQMLNHAAYTAARIPGLTDNQITHALTIAAETVGLDPRETKATIASGITAGHRDGPDPEHNESIPVVLPHPTPSDSAATPEDDDPYEKAVLEEVARLRLRHRAQQVFATELRPPVTTPEILSLRERLAIGHPPLEWRLDSWQPAGTRALLAAQYKAGKTTITGNLARSLVDGDEWLGSYLTNAIDGTVAIIDFEMSERQLDGWLSDQEILHDDRIIVIPLRGKATTFDIIDPVTRAEWAAKLAAHGTQYLILDCLRPVLDALALDEHSEAGRFLTPFDELLDQAGIPDALVVHHMGHQAERSRGDSRLRDWPDVEWRLVRENDDPSSPRYISAFGRDVDISESLVEYNPDSRRIRVVGGTRMTAAARKAVGDILDLLGEHPEGLTKRAIETQVFTNTDHKRVTVRKALDIAIHEQLIRVEKGPHNAQVCFFEVAG